MFGAIFGFGAARFLSQALGHVPVLGNGGAFGPSENNMIQATASGADGLSGFFVAAVPAMYRLSLLSDAEGANPVLQDFGKLTLLTLVCAMFGLCWAVPFRKFFIVLVARELNLVFPSGQYVWNNLCEWYLPRHLLKSATLTLHGLCSNGSGYHNPVYARSRYRRS